MAAEQGFTITLEHMADLAFKVRWDWDTAPPLLMDEPQPLGSQRGPNASRLLAAAVGNCLTASLLFCLQRSKTPIAGAVTRVSGTVTRNEKGRLRVGGFRVRIELPVDAAEQERLARCLSLFEEYCVVTESVRRGIPVEVEVVDREGNPLLPAAPE